jgi:hypothetical protein
MNFRLQFQARGYLHGQGLWADYYLYHFAAGEGSREYPATKHAINPSIPADRGSIQGSSGMDLFAHTGPPNVLICSLFTPEI